MIAFLLQHRTRPALFSRAWLRTWLKRLWNLPALLGYALQSLRWRLKGARIASSSVISHLTVHGDASHLRIGECCCLGITRMQTHERIEIGNCVVINDGVRLITGSHDIHSPTYDHVFSPIIIEDHAWIATDAMILKGVRIGRGAVVTAAAVVTRDVRPFTVVGGNPAREIGTRSQMQNTSTYACKGHLWPVRWTGCAARQQAWRTGTGAQRCLKGGACEL